MPIIETVKCLIRTWAARQADRQAARRSLGALLAKPDDHLIRDIGLSRAEVERMLDVPEADMNPPPARLVHKTR